MLKQSGVVQAKLRLALAHHELIERRRMMHGYQQRVGGWPEGSEAWELRAFQGAYLQFARCGGNALRLACKLNECAKVYWSGSG